MAGSNRHILLQQGSPEAKAEQRRLASAVAIVAGIAVTHVAATQLAAACVRQYPQLTPLLLVWIGTASNLLLLPPQLCRPRHGSPLGLWALRPARLLLLAAPFFLLWIGANGLYISALSRLSSSLVVSIFSATPALVAVLSGPILARPLTLPSTLAVATSVAGVVIAAEPWAAAAAAPPPVGAMSAFGAACCAALYKVLFRHFFGDASGWLLLLFLALLGGYALVLGTPLLFLAQPGWPAALASLPVAGWMLMVGRCGTDVLFNGLIALGLSVTHPVWNQNLPPSVKEPPTWSLPPSPTIPPPHSRPRSLPAPTTSSRSAPPPRPPFL
jgi:drug/metabolite transporter (DMT)-like permease